MTVFKIMKEWVMNGLVRRDIICDSNEWSNRIINVFIFFMQNSRKKYATNLLPNFLFLLNYPEKLFFNHMIKTNYNMMRNFYF